METITIKQLLKACKEEIAKGNGDKYILISGDDEGLAYPARLAENMARLWGLA